LVLHGSKEAKMPSFITIAICGGYIHKMTGLNKQHKCHIGLNDAMNSLQNYLNNQVKNLHKHKQ